MDTVNDESLGDFPFIQGVKEFLQRMQEIDTQNFPLEIEAAKIAERKGRKFPPLHSVASLIRRGDFSAVPRDHWNLLADYLEGTHRGKKGQRSNQAQDDIDIAIMYQNLIDKGAKRKDALECLSSSQNLDVRSVEKTIQRAISHLQIAKEMNQMFDEDPFK